MTRRKTDPLTQAIRDLKYLPRVLEALKALRAKDAEVMALMGGPRTALGSRTTEYAPISVTPEMLEASRANPGAIATSPPASLDTPERREYEEAKRAGRTVPVEDPLKNATDAQRERMAEQRALVQQLRQQRGMPPSRVVLTDAPAVGLEEAHEVVRIEELPTSANGSAGTEEETHV